MPEQSTIASYTRRPRANEADTRGTCVSRPSLVSRPCVGAEARTRVRTVRVHLSGARLLRTGTVQCTSSAKNDTPTEGQYAGDLVSNAGKREMGPKCGRVGRSASVSEPTEISI